MTAAATPTCLIVDTATDRCRLALGTTEHLTISVGERGSSHLEPTLIALDRLLRAAVLPVHQVDLFVFGRGPGAFTGLRVACSVVQGLCVAMGAAGFGVGHLDALAWSVPPEFTTTGPSPACRRLCALDARLGQGYFAAYEWVDEAWQRLAPPSVGDGDDLIELARRTGIAQVIGDATWLRAWLSASTLSLVHGEPGLAAMARLATAAFAAGQSYSADQLQPLYVRNRVAQTVSERRAVQAQLGSA